MSASSARAGVSWPGPSQRPGGMLEAAPVSAITVTDAVKLATAGVKLDFEQLRHHLVPDPPPAEEEGKIQAWWDTAPTRALIARISMNARTHGYQLDQYVVDPIKMFLSLLASQHGDMVHVFVHYRGCEPQIMKDPLHLFPSDALMAQLHLLEEHAKTAPVCL